MERTPLDTLSRLSVLLLAALAVLAAMVVAKQILLPVVLALVVGLVTAPAFDMMRRIGLHPVLATLAALLFVLLAVVAVVAALQPLAVRLVEVAPRVWHDLQETILMLRELARGVEDVGREVSETLDPGKAQAAAAAPAAEGEAVAMPTVQDAILLAPAIAGQVLIFVGTLFFYGLSRSEIHAWAAAFVARGNSRGDVARILRDAESRVARYFLTVGAINAGLGLATAGILSALGLPDALLFGLVAMLMNFLLYLGPALVAAGLFLAGIAAFDGSWAVLPSLAFLTLNAIESQFVTPALVGRALSVNPLLVFLAVVLGLWLWGPLGGVVALPILLWCQAVALGFRQAEARPGVILQ